MNFFTDLFQSDSDDSVTKKLIQGTLGIGVVIVGYYGLTSFVKSQTQNRSVTKELQKANAGNRASQLALRLSTAIATEFYGNTDEAEVFQILSSEISGKAEYQRVLTSYYAITGNYLERDLQENLDPPFMPRTDWERAYKYINQINQRP